MTARGKKFPVNVQYSPIKRIVKGNYTSYLALSTKTTVFSATRCLSLLDMLPKKNLPICVALLHRISSNDISHFLKHSVNSEQAFRLHMVLFTIRAEPKSKSMPVLAPCTAKPSSHTPLQDMCNCRPCTIQ